MVYNAIVTHGHGLLRFPPPALLFPDCVHFAIHLDSGDRTVEFERDFPSD